MKEPGAIAATPKDQKEPKITYPDFSLSDKSAVEFSKDHEPTLGQEYAATVRLRVTSLTADKYGSRVQFEVLELDDVAEEGEETEEDTKKAAEASETEDDKNEEKVLGFKRKKVAKEAPDISAKSLED